MPTHVQQSFLIFAELVGGVFAELVGNWGVIGRLGARPRVDG